MQADANQDRRNLAHPSRPPKRLFHLDDLNSPLGDGTPNRRFEPPDILSTRRFKGDE